MSGHNCWDLAVRRRAVLTRGTPASRYDACMKQKRGLLLIALFLMLCAITAWAHSPWSYRARYRVGMIVWLSGSVGPCSAVSRGMVTLRLRPGGCGGANLPADAPSDIPDGEVPLRIPLYPGAMPSDRYLHDVPQTSVDSYLKAAAASFTMPANATTVVAWYQTRLVSLCPGSGTSIEMPMADATLIGIYRSCGGSPQRWLEIATLPLSDTSSLLEIAAVAHTPPPRPEWSYVPADVTSMTVEFGSNYTRAQMNQWAAETGSTIGQLPWRRTYRDRQTLTRFRNLVNGLDRLTVSAGGVIDPRYTTITFQQPDGARLRFTKADRCFGIVVNGSLPLDDSTNDLDSAISALTPMRT
jgi:hypothetical protein